ncbi:MAG: type II secretion system protein [Gammaproteobacteria bacterium]|nr:type II secretion system protein [Gammaproteobacteria bacterium]
MLATAHHPGRPANRRTPGSNRRGTRGLTLVETLVTFVILGFLATLMLQAVGFFAARFETVQRVYRASTLGTLQQNWFATTVQGLVPTGLSERRLHGDATYFEGTTLEPLNAEPGTPVTARWSIEEDVVLYTESPAPGEEGITWTVRSAAAGSAFKYADSLGNWYDHWPPSADRLPTPPTARPAPAMRRPTPAALPRPLITLTIFDPSLDWTPTLVRMVAPDSATVWLARVEPSRRPVITEASFR